MSLTLLLVEYAPLLVFVHYGLLSSLPVFALQDVGLRLLVHVRLHGRRELAAGRPTATDALQEPGSPNQIIQSNFTLQSQLQALERFPFGRCQLAGVIGGHPLEQLRQRCVDGYSMSVAMQHVTRNGMVARDDGLNLILAQVYALS